MLDHCGGPQATFVLRSDRIIMVVNGCVFFGGRSVFVARTRRRLTKNAFASFTGPIEGLTDGGEGEKKWEWEKDLQFVRTGRQTFTPPLELKNPMMSMATIRHIIHQRFRIGNALSAMHLH
jgi:hypothetical protein